MLVIEEYRGYKICQNTKTKHHKNNISGHEWSTQTLTNGYHVIGKGILSTDKFISVDNAKKKIDFVIKFQIGYETPRSEKELSRAKKYT